jgi:hypothetical protein
MNFEVKDMAEGIGLGLKRARTRLPNRVLYRYAYDSKAISSCLSRCQNELNGRFVALFAELATIAMIARSEYEEPKLTDSELDDFLEHSISFFNSFTHRVVDDENVSEESSPDSNITASRRFKPSRRQRGPTKSIA